MTSYSCWFVKGLLQDLVNEALYLLTLSQMTLIYWPRVRWSPLSRWSRGYHFYIWINCLFFILLLAMPSKDQAQATPLNHMPYDQWMTQSFADQIPDISCNSSNVAQPHLGAETFWRRPPQESHWVTPFLRHHNACVTLEGRWRRNGPSWLDSCFSNSLFKTQPILFPINFYNYLLHFIQHVSSVLFLYF